MSIGWTVALVVAGIMSGGVLGFCYLALVVSGRQNEERLKREQAERLILTNHKAEIDDLVRVHKVRVDRHLTELYSMRFEAQIARAIRIELSEDLEKMREVLVQQDPLRWSERVSLQQRAAAIRKKLCSDSGPKNNNQ